MTETTTRDVLAEAVEIRGQFVCERAAGGMRYYGGSDTYYFGGGYVAGMAKFALSCPVIVHLGHTDPGIKADEVEAAVKAAHPEVPVYIYEGAGHGFNNESPERYHEEAADLARLRTRELFESV